MTADKPRAIPRRHLIRALLGRDIPSATAPAPEPERTAAAPTGDPHAAGNAAYAAGDYAEAAAAYRTSVRGDLSNPILRARLGYALYATRQLIQAKVEFEHVLHLTNGGDAFARLCLGLTLAALGKADKAAANLEAFDAPQAEELTALCRRIAAKLRDIGNGDPAPLILTLERSARAMGVMPEA
jgi:tetratricopeptide (TPR) repeat protein